MARSTYKITVVFLWIALVREVLTKCETLPDTAAPELQGMILGSAYNEESENDANEMARNAADDMGALMASPPIKIFRMPQANNDNQQQQGNDRSEFSGYSNAREAGSSSRPQCNRYDEDLQWYPNEQPSGRSAVARTIPLTPLAPLPIIPGISPIPMLTPLIQSLTNPGRLGLGFGARPLLRTPLPYTPALRTPLPYMPALRTPLPYMPALPTPLPYMPALPTPLPYMPAFRTPLPYSLRTAAPTYQLPRMKRVWIPPSTSRARSSYTPNNYARSAKQYTPLIFYA